MTRINATIMQICYAFYFDRKAAVNLIADERYNPLKSRTKDGQ